MQLDTISLEFSANTTLQSLESATNQWLNDPYSINTFVVLYHPADFEGPNYSVNASKLSMLANYIDYLQSTGRVQFTTLDRSVTTTGNGAGNGTVASPGSDAFNAGAFDGLNGGLVEAAVLAILGVIVIISAASIVNRRRNKNRPKP